MNDTTNIPDFFIVGAPKSGTTALNDFLQQHPDIYMAKKELHYFGSDLGVVQKKLTLSDYLSFFDKASKNQIKGEASVWYLYSQKAANEIKVFNPKAKIIILLRKPTEMIPSLHSQFIFNGDETEKKLEIAFEDDLERYKTNTANPTLSFKNRPTLIGSAMYYQQVRQYLNIFEEDKVHIILYDELKNNFSETYKQLLTFLDISNDFIPQQAKINSRKRVKNMKLHQINNNPLKRKKLKWIAHIAIPSKNIRHRLMEKIDRINIKEIQTDEISPLLKEKIIALTKTDIEKLSDLIGKDLSNWLSPE